MTDKAFQRKLNKIKKQGERYKQIKEVADAYVEYLPKHKEKKKKKVSNIMLCVSVIAIVGYVVADYILQSKIGVELSPTITPYWFAFWTGEIFVLAGMKTSKILKGSVNTNNENDSESEC